MGGFIIEWSYYLLFSGKYTSRGKWRRLGEYTKESGRKH
jgi:hypothetical protein